MSATDSTILRPAGSTAAAVPAPRVRAAREPGGPRPLLWVLTGRGLTAGAIGLVLVGLGLWWHYSTLLGIGFALVLAVGAEVVLVLRRVRLTADRTVNPTVVERHGECMADVEVRGQLPRLVRASVRDRVGQQSISVPVETTHVCYRVPTLRRGLLEVGPLAVDLTGVFGLAARTGEEGDLTHVRVLPRSVPARGIVHGRRRSAVGADESMEQGGTDLVGLHEYVPGDDLRRLHWATSARNGILMVRDDAEPATPHLTVVLDDRGASYADQGSSDTDFEDAVEVAFALCRAALGRNQPVHLLTFSGFADVAVSSRLGAAQADAQQLYAALAEVQVTQEPTRGRLPQRALDCVAVVSGSRAEMVELEDVASRGARPVVLLVDHTTSVQPPSHGTATVLRGPRSTDLTRLWDRAVA